jgi:transposase
MTQKYVEGMPLYRQEKQFERFGVFIPRQTLSRWVIYGATTWLELIYNAMHTKLLELDAIHADETVLQVLSEPGRSATSNSDMWLYLWRHTDVPRVLYNYQRTRAARHPRQFLEDFSRIPYGQNGYSGYNGFPNVILVGCRHMSAVNSQKHYRRFRSLRPLQL